MGSPYCTVDQVKQRMSGDVPTVSDAFDGVISDAIDDVSDMIDQEVRNLRGEGEGWSFLPATQATYRYSGRPGGSRLLLINDAVAVASVTLLDSQGNFLQSLLPNVDYLPYPLNGLPITGLQLTHGDWPWYPGGVSVVLTRGYGATVPPNVTNAVIQEVIRAVRGGQAGEDDRLGMTPYGTVVVSKALLQSTLRLCQRYRFGAAMLRSGI